MDDLRSKSKEQLIREILSLREEISAEIEKQKKEYEELLRDKTNKFQKECGKLKKEAENFRLAEERLQHVANITTDLIYEWDVITDTLVWYGDIDNQLGYKKGEIPHNIEGWIGKIHPEDLKKLEGAVEKHRKSTEPIFEEYRIRQKDGNWQYWIDIGSPVLGKDGLPVKWIGLCKDITSQKRSEEEISLLAHTLKSARDCISITDEKDRIIFVNDAFLDTYGYTEKELTGKDVSIVRSPKVPKRSVSMILPETIRGGWHGEIINRKKDGTDFPVEIWTSVVKDNDGNTLALVGVARDITERKQVEQALSESEEKYRDLVESSDDVVFRLDRLGNITYVSSRVKDYYGWDPDYLTGRHLRTTTPVAEIPKALKGLTAVLSGKQLRNFELKQKAQDGTLYTVEINASPIRKGNKITGMQGVLRDVSEQVKAADALRESEEKFRSFSEHSPNMIFVNQGGKVVYTNKACEEVMGYSIREFLDPEFDFMSLIAPESVDQIKKNFSTHMKGEDIPPYEYVLLKKNGGKINAIITTRLIRYGNRNAILGIITDTTEIKKAEEALRKSEERFRAYMHNATEGIYLLELEKPIPVEMPVDDQIKEIYKGRIEECNLAQAKMYGYDKTEDLIGINLEELHGGTDDPENIEFLTSWINADYKIIEAISSELDKDGNPVWFSNNVTGIVENGCLVRVWGTQTNVTEQRKAQLLLIESETKFRAVFERSNDAIGVSRGGIHVFVNPAYLRLFGYESFSELAGKPVIELIAEPERKRILSNIERRKKGEKVPNNYETTGLRKDGSEFAMDVNTSSYVLNNEKYTLALLRDISDRKQAELELRIAKEQAEESDRLKSAFLSNMSHEIRTPMNAILGFTELLDEPDLTDDERNRFKKIIRDRSNDLLNIINDILDISKIEAGQLKISLTDGNLKTFMQDLADFHLAEMKASNISLGFRQEYNVPDSGSVITTDFDRLRQVLSNLVDNSCKFTRSGYIEIGCALQDDQTLLFHVKDTGIGIPKSKIDVVFERFRQAEDSFLTRESEGTGLGLSISEGLVDLMNGKMWIESEEGIGTTFFFTIPYVFSPVLVEEKKTPKQTDVINWKGKTILIVEDEPANRTYFAEIFSKLDVDLIFAEDGDSAKKVMNENIPVDLVLMDIRLPDINGFELTKIFKEKDPDLKIIAQTAFAAEEDKNKSLEAGCDDYIAKPINKNKLIRIIDKYLA